MCVGLMIQWVNAYKWYPAYSNCSVNFGVVLLVDSHPCQMVSGFSLHTFSGININLVKPCQKKNSTG